MNQFECYHCDALFKVKASSKPDTFQEHYEVMFCPFCGGDIEEGEENEEGSDDE
jgi:hypothetical protein